MFVKRSVVKIGGFEWPALARLFFSPGRPPGAKH